MSMSRKIQRNAKQLGDKLSPENAKWLNEKPTRMEVANYVNALWENHYLPTITNYIQLSAMVLQAILIEKGICTGDEIKSITEKFISEQQRRLAMDTVEDGLIGRLSKAISNVEEGKWVINSEEQTAIRSILDKAKTMLVDINFNKSSNITEQDMGICAGELKSLDMSVNEGTLKLVDMRAKSTLHQLLEDLVTRFEKGLSNEKS